MALTSSRRTAKQNSEFECCACLRALLLSFLASVRLPKFTLQNDCSLTEPGKPASKKAPIQALFAQAMCGMPVARSAGDAVRDPAQCW